MKKVYIDENKIQTIKENEEPLPFQTFFEEIVKFIKDLLNDPIYAKPSEMLITHGITNKLARNELTDASVIVKSENIDEPFDETKGKKVSRYYLSYKVPKENFKDKLRKCYKKMANDGLFEE